MSVEERIERATDALLAKIKDAMRKEENCRHEVKRLTTLIQLNERQADQWAEVAKGLKEALSALVGDEQEDLPLIEHPKGTVPLGTRFHANGLNVAPYVDANGVFNRALVHVALRARNIRLPVGPSHKERSSFVRQSLYAAVMGHPDYPSYVRAGGHNFGKLEARIDPYLYDAITKLGIDRADVIDDSLKLQAAVFGWGTDGVDYTSEKRTKKEAA